MFGDGRDSGAEFAIEDSDKKAEEAIGGWAHAIFVPIPFRNFRLIRVKVAAELVGSEAEVVAEKAEGQERSRPCSSPPHHPRQYCNQTNLFTIELVIEETLVHFKTSIPAKDPLTPYSEHSGKSDKQIKHTSRLSLGALRQLPKYFQHLFTEDNSHNL